MKSRQSGVQTCRSWCLMHPISSHSKSSKLSHSGAKTIGSSPAWVGVANFISSLYFRLLRSLDLRNLLDPDLSFVDLELESVGIQVE